MTNDAKDYVMKTKSKIVLLLAGAAMSASASVAYAQNGGGNQSRIEYDGSDAGAMLMTGLSTFEN